MKKVIGIVSLVLILTGCSSNAGDNVNTLTCVASMDEEGIVGTSTLKFEFKDETVSSASMEAAMEFAEDLEGRDMAIALYTGIMEEAVSELNETEGVSAEVKTEEEAIILSISMDYSKVEGNEFISFDSTTKEELKAEVESDEAGYQCK